MEGEGQEDAAITGARLAHVHREKRKTMASDSNTIASLEGSHYQVTGKYQRGHIGSVVAATDPGGCGCGGVGGGGEGRRGRVAANLAGREAQVRPRLVCLFAIRHSESRR